MVNSSPSGYGEPPAISDLAQEKRELEAIIAVTTAVGSSLELGQVLETAMAKTIELLGSDNGSIHLLEEGSGDLVMLAQLGMPKVVIPQVARVRAADPIPVLTTSEGLPIRGEDMAQRPTIGFWRTKHGDARTVAMVPIRLHGHSLGTLSSARKDDLPVSIRALGHMQAIANAIAPAIENARLYEQEKAHAQALTQEKQLLEAVNAVVAAASSTTDLNEALNLALDKALEVTRQKVGYIHLVDDATGELVLACHRNASPSLVQELQRIKVGNSAVGLAVAEARPILVTNVHTDPRITIQAPKQVNPHSAAFAPLMVRGEARGAMTIVKMKVGGLTEMDLQGLTTIANAVAPAIERARLIKQVRESAQALAREKQELSAINAVVAAASTSLELELVLETALEATIAALGTDAGAIHLLEEASGDLVLKAHHRLSVEAVRDIQRLKIDKSVVGMAVERKEPILLPDITQEPRLATQSTIQQGPRTMAIIPIKLQDRVLGVLTTGQPGVGRISPQDAKLMQSIANAIAPAIEHARLYEQMKDLALTDPLTGLHNMRYLQGELEREVARSRREHARLSLLMMDVDSLKSVNDRYGHEVGSRLLKELGAVFAGALRASDIVARYGGDEFVVVLPNTNPGEAEIVARRIHQRVNAFRLPVKEGAELAVHLSIGIAVFPQQAASAGELLDRADSAVYRSKARGRNQITLYPDIPV